MCQLAAVAGDAVAGKCARPRGSLLTEACLALRLKDTASEGKGLRRGNFVVQDRERGKRGCPRQPRQYAWDARRALFPAFSFER